MDRAVWVVIALAVVGWGLAAMWKRGIANFWRLLADANERYATHFGTSPGDRDTVIGVNLHQGGALAFDRTNRKIAYVTKRGKSIEILSYDFVQSWRITWREKTSGGGAQFGMITVGSANIRHHNVILEITTNDISRPLIHMPMSSLRYAQETAARLQILIHAKS